MSMTEHETLLRLQYMYDSNNSFMVGKRKEIETAMTAIKEIQQYRAIGTVEELRELKEKATEKTPIDYIMFKKCPTCGEVDIQGIKYCYVCGQKLDWSEGKE